MNLEQSIKPEQFLKLVRTATLIRFDNLNINRYELFLECGHSATCSISFLRCDIFCMECLKAHLNSLENIEKKS